MRSDFTLTDVNYYMRFDRLKMQPGSVRNDLTLQKKALAFFSLFFSKWDWIIFYLNTVWYICASIVWIFYSNIYFYILSLVIAKRGIKNRTITRHNKTQTLNDHFFVFSTSLSADGIFLPYFYFLSTIPSTEGYFRIICRRTRDRRKQIVWSLSLFRHPCPEVCLPMGKTVPRYSLFTDESHTKGKIAGRFFEPCCNPNRKICIFKEALSLLIKADTTGVFGDWLFPGFLMWNESKNVTFTYTYIGKYL